jgi:serine phosphatase RsbU (regulator of sigma subunit)/transcriptional regulator with GAF, ATPase, and Fis domain
MLLDPCDTRCVRWLSFGAKDDWTMSGSGVWGAREGIFLPRTSARLWLGIAIAILGPLVITPIVRDGALAIFPGVPYVLIVVAATLVGRVVAATIAIAESAILLDRYVVAAGQTGQRGEQDLLAIVVFVLVAGVVVQLLARLDRTLAIETRERDRLRFLARAGDALSGSLDVDETMKHLGDVLVPALADWFSVDLIEEGAIRNVVVVHPDPAKVELARDLQRRFPTDPDSPTGAPHVIRTGEPELTASITDEMLRALIADPDLLRTMRELHLRCAMVLPLAARGRTFGALTLIGAETHDTYGPTDLELAEEIADRAALAIDTARLFAAESEARAAALEEARRNEVLKDVTAAFGRATTVEEVLRAMLDDGVRTVGAAAGTVGLVGGDRRVEVIGVSGYETDDHPYWHSFGLDDELPLSEAIRDRRPVVLSTTAERDERYPSLQGRGEQRDHALVCLPLLLGEVAIGGFSASYPPGTDFGADDLSFLKAIGEQCAQAIDRARSRERAIRARARFDALATASRALARTLDHDETARTAVQLGLDILGRRATLVLRERDRLAMIARGDAAGIQLFAEREGPDVVPAIAEAIATAMERREPRLIPESGTDELPEVVLPLTIAGSTFGALVVEDPILDFDDEEELGFAREVVRRMARAVENARLYRDKDHAARTLQQSLLPPQLPEVPGVEVESLFLPALSGYDVGGDFYDVFEVADGRWAVVVGDVCGKGVEAAALTGLARHTLRALSDVNRPSEALEALNRALLREHLDGRFCTVALAFVEPDDGGGARVQVASGGHPLPQKLANDGTAHRVGHHGTLLGVADAIHIDDEDVRLDAGESLVLFTDGILAKDEASGDDSAALRRALADGVPPSAEALRDRIQRSVHDLLGEEQYDDVAVLVLRAT